MLSAFSRNMGPLKSRQSGVVLIVGLIFLLVLTLVGTTAMRGTTLQERMVGNVLDRDAAFQDSETVLRSIESDLRQAGIDATLGTIPRPQVELVRSLMESDCSARSFVEAAELSQFWTDVSVETPSGGTKNQQILLMPVPEPGGDYGGTVGAPCIPLSDVSNSANAAGGGGSQYARVDNYFWVIARSTTPTELGAVELQTMYLQGSN